MKVYYGDDGQNYTMMDKICGGGAGEIFPVMNRNNIVAKIFLKREKQRDEKVNALRYLPWSEDIKKFVVLPKVILFEDQQRKRQCGFIMDKAVDRINGSIKIIDTDSFHLTVRKNERKVVLPCTELYPDFFPPEITKLQKAHNNATLEQLCSQGYPTFTLYTDYYCLAYHLHMLLMNCAPFSKAGKPGDIVGKKSVLALPTREAFTINGNYCYSNLSAGIILPEYCPDFNIITPELQRLFIRAFQDGASQPEKRPSPEEFMNALTPFINNLSYCDCDGWNHYIHKSWNKNYCEWCRIEKVSNSRKLIPNNMEDILYMTDQELGYFGHKYKVQADKKAMAYVLYEVACRYCNCGHNGNSKYSANPQEINEHLKKAKATAKGNAPELISKIEMMKP